MCLYCIYCIKTIIEDKKMAKKNKVKPIVRQVLVNSRTGQKYLTLPKKYDAEGGDNMKIEKIDV